jgi:hypothetical protein
LSHPSASLEYKDKIDVVMQESLAHALSRKGSRAGMLFLSLSVSKEPLSTSRTKDGTWSLDGAAQPDDGSMQTIWL